MIRDAHGRNVSKSIGNGIDPLEVIEGQTLAGLFKRLDSSNLDPKKLVAAKEGHAKDFPDGIPECGSDALRFALVSYTAQMHPTRFMLDGNTDSVMCTSKQSSLNYFTKPGFAQERAHAQHALWVCLETGLRLLHPFMPFVTEELWQRLPWSNDCERKASIMICDYPSPIENWRNEKDETGMDVVLATVKSFRAKKSRVARETSKGKTVNEKLKVFKWMKKPLTQTRKLKKSEKKIAEIQKQKDKLQKRMIASGYEEKTTELSLRNFFKN
uniref:valine--tRNA ligase n=1 Tax=Eutrema halophilum TaxID=98038 RepID=C7SI12_EUTHA|nr:valyl-tRNA synthetase-like protein [Eutrema halophilum]